jgi:NAD(P)-dependent dehydrogenase (short-subunit alcohol dehydrogenase family)
MSKIEAIKGLTALVTGGSSGLGRAVAKLLHQNGAQVAVLDLPVSNGKEFVGELGSNAIFTPADVTSTLLQNTNAFRSLTMSK